MNNNIIYLKTVAAFLIWSFLGVLLNKSSFTAFQNAFLLSSFAVLWLFLILLGKRQIASLNKIKLNPSFFMFSLISGVAGVIWLKALTLIPVAQALFLFSSLPIFALLIEIIIFKEKITRIHLLAILSGFIGIVILVSGDLIGHGDPFFSIGGILVLFVAMLFAIQGFLIKKMGTSYPFILMIIIVMFSQMLVSAPFAFSSPWYFENNSFLIILAFSILNGVIAWFFYFDALKFLKVSTVRLIGYLEPMLGSFWGVIFLSQALLPATMGGAIFILLASFLAIKSKE